MLKENMTKTSKSLNTPGVRKPKWVKTIISLEKPWILLMHISSIENVGIFQDSRRNSLLYTIRSIYKYLSNI